MVTYVYQDTRTTMFIASLFAKTKTKETQINVHQQRNGYKFSCCKVKHHLERYTVEGCKILFHSTRDSGWG